jgi:hypothetical protein
MSERGLAIAEGLAMISLLRIAVLVLVAAAAACNSDSSPCHGACNYENGHSCGAGCECASGKCVSGACTNPTTHGVACTSDEMCAPGTCSTVLGICQGQVCQTSADCPPVEECEAGSCKQTFCE